MGLQSKEGIIVRWVLTKKTEPRLFAPACSKGQLQLDYLWRRRLGSWTSATGDREGLTNSSPRKGNATCAYYFRL